MFLSWVFPIPQEFEFFIDRIRIVNIIAPSDVIVLSANNEKTPMSPNVPRCRGCDLQQSDFGRLHE